MPYCKLDDQYAEHPKNAILSDRAFRAQTWAICYANRVLSDGFIPRIVADSFGVEAVTELLKTHWRDAPGGYEIVGYLDWNWSKADVIKRREKSRAAAAARWDRDTDAMRTAVLDAEQDAERPQSGLSAMPMPMPMPKASPSTNTSRRDKPKARSAERAARERDPEFEALAEAFGIDWHHLANGERGKLNRALTDIRSAGDCDVEAIWRRREHLRESGEFTQTPLALAGHWSALKNGPLDRGRTPSAYDRRMSAIRGRRERDGAERRTGADDPALRALPRGEGE